MIQAPGRPVLSVCMWGMFLPLILREGHALHPNTGKHKVQAKGFPKSSQHFRNSLLLFSMQRGQTPFDRGRIFSRVQPFYERAVSNLDP